MLLWFVNALEIVNWYFEHSEVKKILQNGPSREENVDRNFARRRIIIGELAAENARNKEWIRRYRYGL